MCVKQDLHYFFVCEKSMYVHYRDPTYVRRKRSITRYSGIVPTQCDCSSLHDRRKLAVDHGVTHHGNTFNITDQQRYWIDEITKLDQRLYKYGKIILARQVEKLEKEFNVSLCSS